MVRNRCRRQLPQKDGPQRRLSHLRRLRHHIYGHVSFDVIEQSIRRRYTIQCTPRRLRLSKLFLLSGSTPCPMASSGASPTQPAAWETRERGSGSSLASSSDSDHSSEPLGYSSGNISSQVSKYRKAMHAKCCLIR